MYIHFFYKEEVLQDTVTIQLVDSKLKYCTVIWHKSPLSELFSLDDNKGWELTFSTLAPIKCYTHAILS